jgi:hypothetical protein
MMWIARRIPARLRGLRAPYRRKFIHIPVFA